jgi:hypothetical protein
MLETLVAIPSIRKIKRGRGIRKEGRKEGGKEGRREGRKKGKKGS